MDMETGKWGEKQKGYQAAIERCGCIFFIARSTEEAVEKLERAMDGCV